MTSTHTVAASDVQRVTESVTEDVATKVDASDSAAIEAWAEIGFTTEGSKTQRYLRRNGVRSVLTLLGTYPGETWQDRWDLAEAEGWIRDHPVSNKRQWNIGVTFIIFLGLIRPSYDFLLAGHRTTHHYWYYAETLHRTDFDTYLINPNTRGVGRDTWYRARSYLTAMCLHTGKHLRDLDLDDVREVFAWSAVNPSPTRKAGGQHLPAVAYAALVANNNLGPDAPGTTAGFRRKAPTIEAAIARYDLTPNMQEFFTLYFRQRQRQSIKWVTLYANIVTLLGTFWPLVQEVAPGTDSLHLDHAAWDDLYDRLSLRNDGSERIGADATRSEIRMLYTDIQQWAVLNPALWQRYVASCPWGKELARGQRREKRTRKSRMDSKTREQTLTVNALRTAARQNWLHSSGLLAAAREVGPGDTFAHHGIDYTRVVAEGKHRRSDQQVMPLSVRDADGQLIRVSLDEDKDFWAYVLIEVLYQTGIRIEEALEICVQSIENWQSATGFAMPVLRIAPSKMDKERLVPLSPEALAVLAQASARLKKQHNGQVPLVPAVDGHERTDLPALAYLFQRAPFGQSVRIGYSGVAGIFRRVVKVGNVRDASGHRVHFTPHDFRRLFVSRTVNSGLPIQVAQVICGHDSITTTQGYFAIDEDRAMLAYKKYLQAQRQERPAEEYAPPSEADVAAGQNFIARRQVRLGRCDRGHGQDCERGHQCVACPALRLNDDAEPLLAAEAAASQARLLDAEKDGFLCEAEGLRERLQAIQDTRESLAVREEIRSAGPGEDPNTFTSVTTT